MTVYIGIDWSQLKRDVCFMNEAGKAIAGPTQRMDKHTGIVAIARKLLVMVWHVRSCRGLRAIPVGLAQSSAGGIRRAVVVHAL